LVILATFLTERTRRRISRNDAIIIKGWELGVRECFYLPLTPNP
jgi:hypothetical protein